MMNKNTSYKRIVSLVLAVVMFAAMFAVSAAENTMIFVNGDLAENGAVYDGAVTVSIEGDFSFVTVNGDLVELGDSNTFVIDPETDDTATADTADTADTATDDTAASVIYADGAVKIVVYNEDEMVVSAVNFTIKAVETTDEAATDDKATDDEATDDQATEDQATSDEATDDQPETTDEATDDQPETTDVATDDKPETTDVATDDQPETGDEPTTKKFLNGDVNFDGIVDSYDALLILRYSVGLEDFDDIQKVVGDVNGDGENYSNDALTVLRASVGLEELNPEYVDVVVK